MSKEFLISKQQLERLFPFFINIDTQQNITSFGVQISKMSVVKVGDNLQEHFQIHPKGMLDAPFAQLDGKSCQLVQWNDSNAGYPLILQGELLYLHSSDELVLFGTPSNYARKSTTPPNENALKPDVKEILDTVSTDFSAYDNTVKENTEVIDVVFSNIAGVAVTNANGAIEWISKEFEASMGCTLAEVVGKRPRDVIYGKSSTYIPSSYVDEMVKKRAPFSFDNIGYNKHGKSFWFRTTVYPIIDRENEITGRYYVFQDITETKLKDDFYRQSRDIWKFAVTASGDGVWGYDAKTNIMTVSIQFRELLGLPHTQPVTAKSLINSVHGEDRKRLIEAIIQTKKDRSSSLNFELRIKHTKLGWHFYQIRAKYIPTQTSDSILLFGTLRDIQQEKDKDLELQRTTLRLQTLVERMHFGVLLETEERTITLVNKEFIKLLDVDMHINETGEMKYENISATLSNSFVEADNFYKRTEEIVAKKTPVVGEVFYLKDGRIVELDYMPITIENQYRGHLWKYSDVTAQKQTLQKLQSSELRLTTLMNSLKQAVLFEDENRTVLFANKAMADTIGEKYITYIKEGKKSVDTLQDIMSLFREPMHELNRIEQLVSDGIPVENDYVYLTNGKVMSRLFTPLSIGNENSGFMWVYDDITDSINHQQTLLSQKEYYHRILDELPADVVIMNPDNTFSFANKSAIKDKETRNWIIGKTMIDYCIRRNIDISFAEGRNKLFEQVRNSKLPTKVIDYYPHTKEGKKYVMRVLSPFESKDGQLEFVVAYGIDITEQMINEQRAEEQERNVRSLLNFTNDGIFTCNNNLNITFYNPSFAQIAKIPTSQDEKERNLLDLIPQDEHKKVLEILCKVADDTHAPSVIVRVLNLNGEEHFWDLAFILNTNKNANGYIGKITDITEQINKQRNLEAIIEREQLLNQSKSQFIRIASHELRTPLAIIQANAELLVLTSAKMPSSDSMTAKTSVMLSRIVKEVIHMTEILNQLLMVSKVESGKIEYNPEITDVRNLVREIFEDLYHPHSDGRQLEIRIPGKAITAFLDKKLIRYAVVNLVNNAFKYSPNSDKSPILTLDETDEAVNIEVEDFGIGIPPEDQPKLFNTFFRASNTGKVSGSGLGLTIVDYVIKIHNGQISYNCKPDNGMIFRLTVPKQQQGNDKDTTD